MSGKTPSCFTLFEVFKTLDVTLSHLTVLVCCVYRLNNSYNNVGHTPLPSIFKKLI